MKKGRMVHILIWCVGLVLPSAVYAAVTMKGIHLTGAPPEIRLEFSEKPPFKVVQIDDREVLVAFRDAVAARNLRRTGTGGGIIRDIEMNRLPGGDMALMVRTYPALKSVNGRWENGAVLRLYFDPATGKKTSLKHQTRKSGVTSASDRPAMPADDRRTAEATETNSPSAEYSSVSSVESSEVAPSKDANDTAAVFRLPTVLPEKTSVSGTLNGDRFSGTIKDFIRMFDTSPCAGNKTLLEGLKLCDAGKWADARAIFSGFVDEQLTGDCIDAGYYLRAFTSLQLMTEDDADPAAGVTATEQVFDALSLFPDSAYVPYGYAMLGKVYFHLKNYDRAQGYYRIVLEKYPDISMKPEILYDDAQIHDEADENAAAEALYLKVLETYPEFPQRIELKYRLGNLYYDDAEYTKAIEYLTDVMAAEPRRVFEDGDLLFRTGTAYYQMGQSHKAREMLARAYNLFPDLDAKDIILSRIGDTYVDTDEIDRAVRVFQLVTEKYPGTDGFVISTMRLARYLDDVEKKKSNYRLIINEYPDNPLSRLALFRLADVLNKNAEYQESIKTIKQLIATDDRALRVEANFLLQQASMSQFDLWLQDDKYPLVISRFEEDKAILNKAEYPELFLSVGRAYLAGHFYEQSLDNFLKAYKRYPKGKRPDTLIRGMGVAMKALGKYDDALKMFASYRKYFPDANDTAWIFAHEGDIRLAQQDPKTAVRDYEKAYRAGNIPEDQAAFLEKSADALKAAGHREKAADELEKAASVLSSVPDRTTDVASLQLKAGRIYLELKKYSEAITTFEMALNLLGEVPGAAEVRYLLAGALEQRGDLEEAVAVYNKLVETDDSMWAELGRTRLKGIALDARLNPAG